VEIRVHRQIRNHVEEYYKDLFGAEERGGISLGESFWDVSSTLTNDEADELTKPFIGEEIEDALKGMDYSSAPGPDGLL
jgi:DNA-directed RNA polymerase delta subunit